MSRYLDEHGHIRPELVQEGGPDVEAYSENQSVRGGDDGDMIVLSRKLKIRDPIRAIERIAHMCGWDKQGPIVAEGVSIYLHMGDD